MSDSRKLRQYLHYQPCVTGEYTEACTEMAYVPGRPTKGEEAFLWQAKAVKLTLQLLKLTEQVEADLRESLSDSGGEVHLWG